MNRTLQGMGVWLLSALSLLGCSRTRQASDEGFAANRGADCDTGERGCACETRWDCEDGLGCIAGRCGGGGSDPTVDEPLPMIPPPGWPDMMPPIPQAPSQTPGAPPPPAQPSVCGNGILEWGERCDGGPIAGACMGPEGQIGDVLCVDCQLDYSQCNALSPDPELAYCTGFAQCGWFDVQSVGLCASLISPDCQSCVMDVVTDAIQWSMDEDAGVALFGEPCAVPIDQRCAGVCTDLNGIDL